MGDVVIFFAVAVMYCNPQSLLGDNKWGRRSHPEFSFKKFLHISKAMVPKLCRFYTPESEHKEKCLKLAT